MKKVLFVYPHNFLELNMGTNIRVYALAKELHAMGFKIDLFALENFMSTYGNFEQINEAEKLIDTLYLCDYKKIKTWKKRRERLQKGYKFLIHKKLDDWASPYMVQQFNKIVAATEYSHIVMFYTYTAELFSPRHYVGKETTRKIYFMEDLLSVSEYIQKKSSTVGGLLDCELHRLEYFDHIVCISYDEKIIVEKLLRGQQKFYFLPHLVTRQETPLEREVGQKLRVTFVGYDNPYNVEGMQWFFDKVYPLLDDGMDILLVGKVNKHIACPWTNVKQIEYVEDLETIYRHTDVVICPLLNGTGMKIKVVEAMSHAIPVVCTPRGVDGFPDKTCNGCLVAESAVEFADYLNRLALFPDFYHLCQERVVSYFDRVLGCWDRHRKLLADIFAYD